MATDGPRASLDLTHVLYNDDSTTSLVLALITLSPILLMPAYAALAVQTRELTVIVMWAGQLACEAINWGLKRAVKQDRPKDWVGNGYGWPSSHSQYMGYFASFLICHLYFRHRFSSSGFPVLDLAFRVAVYLALVAWAAAVAFSRFYLTYHTTNQILSGLSLGVLLGTSLYLVAEHIPFTQPNSFLGRARTSLLDHPWIQWIEVRDGWALWSDAGRDGEWKRWRTAWEENRKTTPKEMDSKKE